jgi:hypothetical protein
MRGTGLAVLAAMMLTGCDLAPKPPLADAPLMLAAYESFKAGNEIAVGQAHDVVAARMPADPTVIIRCDAQGFAVRRAASMKERLDFLDSGTAMSLGEPARFVHLEGLLFEHEAGKREAWPRLRPPEVDCRGSPLADTATRQLDAREAQAMRADAERFMSQWRKDLHAALGAEYRPAMQRAAERLNANHLRSRAYWRENGNYD